MTWHLKKFAELSVVELYALLRLRAEVFVVEQNCPYNDIDNTDQECYHFYAQNEQQQILAYTRLVPPNVHYTECSIGRVVTHPSIRGTTMGRQLMQKSIAHCETLFNHTPIKIGAQLYLKKFYESFGFVQISEEYVEDNIPHIKMLLA